MAKWWNIFGTRESGKKESNAIILGKKNDIQIKVIQDKQDRQDKAKNVILKKELQEKQFQLLQEKLEELTDLTRKNINLAILRSEKIDKLDKMAQDLEEQAKQFQRGAKKVKEKQQEQNLLPVFTFLGAAFGFLYAISAGFTWPFILLSIVANATLGFLLGWATSSIRNFFNRGSISSKDRIKKDISESDIIVQDDKSSDISFKPKKEPVLHASVLDIMRRKDAHSHVEEPACSKRAKI